MDDFPDEISAVQDGLAETLARALQYLPQLIGALLIVLLTWIIARITRGLILRGGGNVNRILDRFFKSGALASARLSASAVAMLSEISFWVIAIVGLTLAARAAGFTGLSTWFGDLVWQIPNFLVGAAIIFIGYLVSRFVGEQVSAAAGEADAPRNESMGRLAQSAIFVTALIFGLDQIGVDVSFLIVLFAISVGAIFGGFSIAFGLGARDYVGDMIATRCLRRQLSAGLAVRIGDIEGEILEITPTHVAIETADGKLLLPGRLATADAITIVSGSEKRVSPEPADG